MQYWTHADWPKGDPCQRVKGWSMPKGTFHNNVNPHTWDQRVIPPRGDPYQRVIHTTVTGMRTRCTLLPVKATRGSGGSRRVVEGFCWLHVVERLVGSSVGVLPLESAGTRDTNLNSVKTPCQLPPAPRGHVIRPDYLQQLINGNCCAQYLLSVQTKTLVYRYY